MRSHPLSELGSLSPAMEKVLADLKDHIQNKMGISDPRYDDRYLLRFCRARDFDLVKVRVLKVILNGEVILGSYSQGVLPD
jgi:hypothetical protein